MERQGNSYKSFQNLLCGVYNNEYQTNSNALKFIW